MERHLYQKLSLEFRRYSEVLMKLLQVAFIEAMNRL